MNRDEVETVLRRMLKVGVLRRLPRSRKDQAVLLALAASALDPRSVYTEAAFDALIEEWAAGFTDPMQLDCVTIRRYLVDHRLVMRDPAGSSYRANQVIINRVIDPGARSVQPRYVLDAVREDQARRRRAKGR